MEREYMEFDVVIVGAGPAGLSAACRLKQKAAEAGKEISVCVVEKGSEVGAHILSGAVFEPRALNELFPDWKALGAPLNTPVVRDDIYVLRSSDTSTKVPDFFVPKTMHNEGNYIISLGNLCRWLAQQAENLGDRQSVVSHGIRRLSGHEEHSNGVIGKLYPTPAARW